MQCSARNWVIYLPAEYPAAAGGVALNIGCLISLWCGVSTAAGELAEELEVLLLALLLLLLQLEL